MGVRRFISNSREPFFFQLKRRTDEESLLETVVVLLSFALLLHPISWQHYFAVLLPFLIVKLGQKQFKYLPSFILISLNGASFHLPGIYQGLINSSQFLGTLLIYALLVLNRQTDSI